MTTSIVLANGSTVTIEGAAKIEIESGTILRITTGDKRSWFNTSAWFSVEQEVPPARGESF
jgi:hypothetical protein